MTPRPRVLVVVPEPARRQDLVLWLASAGYDRTIADDFLEAKHLLDADAPDLLVTDVRLGAHNGLHLVIRGRSRDASLRAIVIGAQDPVLELEAVHQRATYLTHPLQQTDFLRAVSEAIFDGRPGRRTPRKYIPPLTAFVEETEAVLLDVSYDGARVELRQGPGRLPRSFTLRLPAYELAISARWVWMTPACGGNPAVARYGLRLSLLNPAISAKWRSVVDTIPGSVVVAN